MPTNQGTLSSPTIEEELKGPETIELMDVLKVGIERSGPISHSTEGIGPYDLPNSNT